METVRQKITVIETRDINPATATQEAQMEARMLMEILPAEKAGSA